MGLSLQRGCPATNATYPVVVYYLKYYYVHARTMHSESEAPRTQVATESAQEHGGWSVVEHHKSEADASQTRVVP